MTRPVPIAHEAAFHLEELFFSTTDAKGFITFGNDVFIRVSGYEAAQLVGQPHNIIRHPDMPRVVFWLLWDRLLKGQSVVAYVKNMAKDGSYYWVCAFVAPIAGGYLSIRMKPTGPLFAHVQKLYGTLLAGEQEAERVDNSRPKSIQASRVKLEAALAGLGYATYEDFMHEMLLSEFLSRKQGHTRAAAAGAANSGNPLRKACASLARRVEGLFSMLDSFLQLEKSLTQHLQFARAFGLKLQFLTLNAQLRAAALQERGLQVVAGQMSFSAGLLGKSADELTRAIASVMQLLKEAAYEIAACNLSTEMMSSFLAELSDQELDNADSPLRRHSAQLASVVGERFCVTAKVLGKTAANLRKFEIALHDFSRQIRTLDILHVTGRIESVNATEGGGFTGVLQDLVSMTSQARTHLTDIKRLVEKVEFTAIDDSATEQNLSLLTTAP